MTTVAIWMDEEDKKVEYLAANHEERDPTRSRQRGIERITSVVLTECVHAHRDSKLFCGNSVNVNLNIFF